MADPEESLVGEMICMDRSVVNLGINHTAANLIDACYCWQARESPEDEMDIATMIAEKRTGKLVQRSREGKACSGNLT